MAEEGSDWSKDEGEEGGAIKGNAVVDVWFTVSVTGAADAGTVGSGTRVA